MRVARLKQNSRSCLFSKLMSHPVSSSTKVVHFHWTKGIIQNRAEIRSGKQVGAIARAGDKKQSKATLSSWQDTSHWNKSDLKEPRILDENLFSHVYLLHWAKRMSVCRIRARMLSSIEREASFANVRWTCLSLAVGEIPARLDAPAQLTRWLMPIDMAVDCDCRKRWALPGFRLDFNVST